MPLKPLRPDIPWGEGGADALHVQILSAPNDHEAVAEALGICVKSSFAMMKRDRLPVAWIVGLKAGIVPAGPDEPDGLPKAYFAATVRKPE